MWHETDSEEPVCKLLRFTTLVFVLILIVVFVLVSVFVLIVLVLVVVLIVRHFSSSRKLLFILFSLVHRYFERFEKNYTFFKSFE